jgi:hypothetical protein
MLFLADSDIVAKGNICFRQNPEESESTHSWLVFLFLAVTRRAKQPDTDIPSRVRDYPSQDQSLIQPGPGNVKVKTQGIQPHPAFQTQHGSS